MKAIVSDKEADVRGRAANTLGRIGSEKAVEGLKAALEDEGFHYGDKVKDAAFGALEKISRRMGKRIEMINDK